jgi:choline monooxygenase
VLESAKTTKSLIFPPEYTFMKTNLWVHEDISLAKTLQKDFYLSSNFFEEAKEKIFAQTWQWLTCGSLGSEPGNCAPVTLLPGYLDEPLLITTDAQGKQHCISNVCTHRGAQLVQQPCTVTNIRCPYHGRLFGLDGSFKSMPEFKEVQNFPAPSDNLTSLPLQSFAGSLFTRLSGDASFEQFFGPMKERLNWMPFDSFSYRPDLSKAYEVKAHWALYCENYLEGFHIPFVHPALNASLDFGNYRTELYEYSSLQLGIAKSGEDCFALPKSSPDFGQNVAAYYYFVFPNLMFNFYPWGLSLNVVEPLQTDLTRVSFYSFVWKPEKLQQGAGADVDATEMEDETVVESVQQGIRSRFYEHGRYSVKHETGTHHFHRLIAEWMGRK